MKRRAQGLLSHLIVAVFILCLHSGSLAQVSDQMLIPISDSIYANRQIALANDEYNPISVPRDLVCMRYNKEEIFFVMLDSDAHRLLYGEMDESWNMIMWKKVIGTKGQSSTEAKFLYPRGVSTDRFSNYQWLRDDVPRKIYVADTGNNQIVKLHYETGLKGTMTFEENWQGFRRPYDVDVHNKGTVDSENDDIDDEVWVADNGNRRLVVLDNQGGLVAHIENYIDMYGAVRQFKLPRRLVIRQRAGVDMDTVLVLHGNKTLSEFSIGGSYSLTEIFRYESFPDNAIITDIEYDSRRNFYALDNTNNMMYKFSPSGEYLASYGGFGYDAVDKFVSPLTIANIRGKQQIFVMEHWGDLSGGKGFHQGADVFNMTATNTGEYAASFTYKLTNKSKVRAEIEHGLVIEREIFPQQTQTSGTRSIAVQENLPPGLLVLVINAEPSDHPNHSVPEPEHRLEFSLPKPHMKSLNQEATGMNNGRRLVRGSAGGWYHLTYEDGRNVYYANSSNNGSSWSSETMVSDGLGLSINPSIAYDRFGDRANITLIWEESFAEDGTQSNDIKYRRKEGSSFLPIGPVETEFTTEIGHVSVPVISGSTSGNYSNLVAAWNSGNGLKISYYDEPNDFWINYDVQGTGSGAKDITLDGWTKYPRSSEFAILWHDVNDDIRFTWGNVSPLSINWTLQNSYNLSQDAAQIDVSTNPSISVEFSSSPTFHAVWHGEYEDVSEPGKAGTEASGTQHSIFYRKKVGSSGNWGTTKEFQHGSHQEYNPSLASYSNSDNVSIVWKCGDHIYGVNYNGTTITNSTDFGYGGSYPNLNTGSTDSRVVWANSPSPYDILTGDDTFGDAGKRGEGKNTKPEGLNSKSGSDDIIEYESVQNLTIKRKGYIDLSEVRVTGIPPGTMAGGLMMELSQAEVLLNDGAIEQVQFDTLDNTSNPKWLFSAPFIVPGDAESLFVSFRFTVKDFWLDPEFDRGLRRDVLHFFLSDESNPNNNLMLKKLKLIDIVKADTSLYYLAENVGISLYDRRNKGARVAVHLIGRQGGHLPAYTEVFRFDAPDSTGGKRGGFAKRGSAGAIPKVYALSQNYPNPFNPVTKIDFALPEAGATSLVIYNLLGREVARLVDDEMPAGYHSAYWNADRAASGIYLYRLTSGDYVKVRKMVLMK